ncbi:hypothetical protein ACFWM3_07390 [Gottfriedia sp. NPDC058432]
MTSERERSLTGVERNDQAELLAVKLKSCHYKMAAFIITILDNRFQWI